MFPTKNILKIKLVYLCLAMAAQPLIPTNKTVMLNTAVSRTKFFEGVELIHNMSVSKDVERLKIIIRVEFARIQSLR